MTIVLTHETPDDVQAVRRNERKALMFVAVALVVAALLIEVELYFINSFVNSMFSQIMQNVMENAPSTPTQH